MNALCKAFFSMHVRAACGFFSRSSDVVCIYRLKIQSKNLTKSYEDSGLEFRQDSTNFLQIKTSIRKIIEFEETDATAPLLVFTF